MSNEGVVKYDERGVMDGGTVGLPRKMNRDIWLKEVFPEWGTYLNYEIDTFEVKPGRIKKEEYGPLHEMYQESKRLVLQKVLLRKGKMSSGE